MTEASNSILRNASCGGGIGLGSIGFRGFFGLGHSSWTGGAWGRDGASIAIATRLYASRCHLVFVGLLWRGLRAGSDLTSAVHARNLFTIVVWIVGGG